MLSAALFLLANSLFLTLRLTGDTGSFPKPLSAGEERMYLERSLAGDLEARNILVEHNLRLVAHIIKKYYTQAAEQEDLISIGTIGLIKAVDTFRPERKIRLATYASRCVENEVLMYFRSRKKLQGEVSLSDTIEPDAPDGTPVHYKNVIGKPVFSVPYLGYFANFVQNPPGLYFAIGFAVVLVLLVFLPDLLDDSGKKGKGKGAGEDPTAHN